MLLGGLFILAACSNPPVPSTTPNETPVTTEKPDEPAANTSDPIVILKIQSIAYSPGASGAWRLDVRVESTLGGSDLPTPVTNSLGEVVTVMSDQDMSQFKAGDTVNAKIKDVGDVDLPAAVVLYVYDMVKP